MASIPWTYFQDSASITGFTFAPLGSVADGATVFTELDDAPASYAGQGLKHVRVNSAGTAVEFVAPTLTQLSDAPANYTSAAGKYLLVNSAGTAVEFNYPNGVTNGGDASAGKVGEFLSDGVLGVTLVTDTPKTLTSLTLTAGDWDVRGITRFNPAATTNITRWTAGSSLTNNDFEPAPTYQQIPCAPFVPNTVPIALTMPMRRCSISSITTVYLIGMAVFTVSTMGADGWLWARRIR